MVLLLQQTLIYDPARDSARVCYSIERKKVLAALILVLYLIASCFRPRFEFAPMRLDPLRTSAASQLLQLSLQVS
jgi:hypothetical protein